MVKNTMSGTTSQPLSGHHHNQTLMVNLKKWMSLTQSLTNIMPILHLLKETEELLSVLDKFVLKEITVKNTMNGQTSHQLSGLHHNQTLMVTLKKLIFLTQSLTNIMLILHLPKETEELLSGLKFMETINQKEPIKELIN